MEEMIGKLLGSGGTSNVYEWGNTKVVKIFKSHVSDDAIKNEMYIGQILSKFPLDMPKCIGSIDLKGKMALIYERINGEIMAEPLLKGIYKTELANKFAQMHYDIHREEINELPSQYEFLKNRIIELRSNLGDKSTQSLLSLLDSIPIDNRLCHGDFQPFNIIGKADKYIAIDWNDACSGNPILDVAWSYMTLNSPIIKRLLGESISEIFAHFTKDYLSYYCKLTGSKQEHIHRCLPIVASRRLYDNLMHDNENSRQENEWLYNFIQKA